MNRRQKLAIVEKAINSVSLEGLTISKEQQVLFDRFVDGDITAGELNVLTVSNAKN